MKIFNSKSPEETFEIARNFAAELKAGDIVAFNGDLGVGKTVFVKGICDYLGVTEYVNSPTYTLVNEYHGKENTVYHMDIYRIEDEDELFNIGFFEFLSEGGIVLMEWAENAEDSLSEYDVIRVDIKRDGENREIKIYTKEKK